jgi:predicted CXXCH cytochrome family protein
VTDDPANSFHLGWEIAQGLGLLAALCALLLCLRPIRPRLLRARTISLRRHEILGWLMLAAAVTHVAVALSVDRTSREHLRLTAPLYEWAGIGALLACLFLTVPSTAALRSRLWSRHRNFQALHVGVTCLLLALIAAHVVTTNRLVHGPLRIALYLGLSAAALLALFRARRNVAGTQVQLGFTQRLVFGRHSRLLLVLAAVAMLGIVTLFSTGTVLALRAPLKARTTPLALSFPHEKHRAVNCLQCHHNFTDQTGADSCISCHRSNRAEIRVSAEARFHDFCLGCHRDPPAQFTHHGPVTGCDACHAPATWRVLPPGGAAERTPAR